MKTKNGGNLTKKQIMGYAFGDLGGCMTFAIMGSFLLPYYTEVAGISSGTVAFMFFILKIWDAINDPMMGAIMDKMFAKTHNKHGKFRPWMMRATPLLLITAILMFT
ncbi:MAG: MFS transporter, partial [Oscillospiraceae bacterium]